MTRTPVLATYEVTSIERDEDGNILSEGSIRPVTIDSSDLDWSTDGSTGTPSEHAALVDMLVTWLKNDYLTDVHPEHGNQFYDVDAPHIQDYATGSTMEEIAEISASAEVLADVRKALSN